MPGAARLGDKAKAKLDAHGGVCCSHPDVQWPGVTCSPNVCVNGVGALTITSIGVHAACCGSNTWIMSGASSCVFINNTPMVRKGDPTLHCGVSPGEIIDASANVIDNSPLNTTLLEVALLALLGLDNDMPIPPNVGIDINIKEALAHRHGGIPDPRDLLDVIPNPNDLLEKLPWPFNEVAKIPGPLELIKKLPNPLDLIGDKWFYDQVKAGGPWDYKTRGLQYENFGNFNYGATGRALGLPREILLRAAGIAQIKSGHSGEGHPWDVGKSSYGDDPKDQAWITRGMDYYDNNY